MFLAICVVVVVVVFVLLCDLCILVCPLGFLLPLFNKNILQYMLNRGR